MSAAAAGLLLASVETEARAARTQLRRRDPLDALARIGTAKTLLAQAEAEAVIDARKAGASWADVGRRLDISKQAAAQRFAGLGVS